MILGMNAYKKINYDAHFNSDSVPNRFMVLMKFRTKEATAEFYTRYNGKPFSSLEVWHTSLCILLYHVQHEIATYTITFAHLTARL